jgi:uridine phosphorylase
MDLPILEYDPSPTALFQPDEVVKPLPAMPSRCVLCFFQDVITTVCADLEPVAVLGSEIGPNPVYALDVSRGDLSGRVAVVHPGVGAPLAAGFMEELIALGATQFIACGGAGVLNAELALGHLIVPDVAVRDEGTSYHYLPPAREVGATPAAVEAITATLDAHETPYVVGKTWTTDAIYRETKARIARRRAEGCITVEMEAAAFFAVAAFRGVTVGQILYGGDDVSGDLWDGRDWQRAASVRERVFWLAVEAALRL